MFLNSLALTDISSRIIWLKVYTVYIPETLQANPSAIISQGTIVGPALAECLKDANTPVRLAAERCILHAFHLTKGTFTCKYSLSFLGDIIVGHYCVIHRYFSIFLCTFLSKPKLVLG